MKDRRQHLFVFKFGNESVARLRVELVAAFGDSMTMEWSYVYVGKIDSNLPPEDGPEFTQAFKVISETMNEAALTSIES